MSTFEQLLAQAQASKGTLGELTRFNTALVACDGLTVAQFERLVAEAMGKAPPPKKAAAKTLNEELVARYSGKLAAAGEDRARFEGAMSELMADKSVRISEWSAIAHAYVGGTSAYKKKADAIKDIRLRFDAKLSATRRLEAQSDIF